MQANPTGERVMAVGSRVAMELWKSDGMVQPTSPQL